MRGYRSEKRRRRGEKRRERRGWVGDKEDEFAELKEGTKKSCRQGSGEKNNIGRRQKKKNVTLFGLVITCSDKIQYM